ncbi:MAG TPA: maleylpyruvate isomerase family mycothiol-dependent enzyme [Lapillicoccus sp.]|nr:maleylpyruvate isomerase family mycothiol-dependent enzyme [Lapillicoccus sp.]
MPLTQQECTDAIAEHSAGFAAAAEGNFDAPVEFCPGWTVRDVVHHLTRVQWFWATLVEEQLSERPDRLEEPEPAADDVALSVFRTGADRLVRVLGSADPATPVWTWAPSQQDAAFVIRHQVQEVVGHHWDVAHAAGRSVSISSAVGADSVDEFLHLSVSNADDAAGDDPLPGPLEGRFGLACTDSDAAWLVVDGDPPGTAAITRTSRAALDGIPTVRGTGGQLLLWIYDRHGDPNGDADDSALDPELRQRFRGLCFTD